MRLKNGFEVGNWNIESYESGKGFIQNFMDNREATYFVGFDFQIYIYNIKGTQIPLPSIPKYIQHRIVAMERHNRKAKKLGGG
ncbi:hypothetical protein [Brevibacillus laterosporus]|uniref:hypothetical protein n=1 Tax=Brevibacillus laterosporus TaxID=1465 RepID=UPI003D1B7B6F